LTSQDEADRISMPYFHEHLAPHGCQFAGWYVDQEGHLGRGIRTRPAVVEIAKLCRPGDIILVTSIVEWTYRSVGMCFPSILTLLHDNRVSVHFAKQQIVVAEGTPWHNLMRKMYEWSRVVGSYDVGSPRRTKHIDRNWHRSSIRGFRWTSLGTLKPLPDQVRLIRQIAQWRASGLNMLECLTQVSKQKLLHPVSNLPFTHAHVNTMYILAGRMNTAIADIKDGLIAWQDLSPSMRILCDDTADLSRQFATDEAKLLSANFRERGDRDIRLSSTATNALVALV